LQRPSSHSPTARPRTLHTTTMRLQGTNSTETGKNGARMDRPKSRRPTWPKATTKDPAPTNPTLTLLHLQRTHILKALFPEPTISPPPSLARTAWSTVLLYQVKKSTSRDILPGQPSEIPIPTRCLSCRCLARPRINRIRKPTRREYRRMSQAGFRGLLLSPTEPATAGANSGRDANTDGNNKSNPDSSHNMARSSRNTLVHRIQN